VHNDHTEFNEETVIPIGEVIIVELDVPTFNMTRKEQQDFWEKKNKEDSLILEKLRKEFNELYPIVPEVKGWTFFWDKYEEANPDSYDILPDEVMDKYDAGEEVGLMLEPYGVNTEEYIQYMVLVRERREKWGKFLNKNNF